MTTLEMTEENLKKGVLSGIWKRLEPNGFEFENLKTHETYTWNPSENKMVPVQENKPVPIGIDEMRSLSVLYGIPESAMRMFFTMIPSTKTGEETLYVKAAGLMWLARKKGFQAIKVMNEKGENGEFRARCEVLPLLTNEQLRQIAAIQDRDQQKRIIDYLTEATIGYGRASKDTVKENSPSYKFLEEMARTRAIVRALRVYTGFGATAEEELPEGRPYKVVE